MQRWEAPEQIESDFPSGVIVALKRGVKFQGLNPMLGFDWIAQAVYVKEDSLVEDFPIEIASPYMLLFTTSNKKA